MKRYTALGVLCVAALFAAAMLFPEYYNRLYDQKTLDQATFTDVNISTYETSYDSFVEKLYALAKVQYEGNPLRAVRTSELELTMDKTSLTKIFRKELKKLKQAKVIGLEKKPLAKNLARYERYTIYASNDDGGMKGISCWKLVYETSKKDITVYLDEEYHKIYYLKLRYKSYKDTDKTSEVSSGGYADEGKPVDIYDHAMSGDWVKFFWEGITQAYYEIYSYQDGTCNSWVTENGAWGVISFDNIYELGVMGELFREDGMLVYKFGIPVEEMIQF